MKYTNIPPVILALFGVFAVSRCAFATVDEALGEVNHATQRMYREIRDKGRNISPDETATLRESMTAQSRRDLSDAILVEAKKARASKSGKKKHGSSRGKERIKPDESASEPSGGAALDEGLFEKYLEFPKPVRHAGNQDQSDRKFVPSGGDGGSEVVFEPPRAPVKVQKKPSSTMPANSPAK